ncbi:hypothetical protein VKT23_017503 [Stygiomarasmius scandens]|uniref:Uncharacterized protein n=1 Tax=Marasmiellus scandens TaxID=2682957 RepID=A0ABR1IUY2_9AGAR
MKTDSDTEDYKPTTRRGEDRKYRHKKDRSSRSPPRKRLHISSDVSSDSSETSLEDDSGNRSKYKNWTDLPTLNLSDPAPDTTYVPLDPQPDKSEQTEFDQKVIFTSLTKLEGGVWAPWSQGRFALNLTYQQLLPFLLQK